MKENKSMWHYVFGLLSGLLFIPVIEEFSNVIMSWIQVLLLKPTEKVLKGNQEIYDLQEASECQVSNCIGFQVPNEYEYYDDDEYDE